jgi:hypothetical protein
MGTALLHVVISAWLLPLILAPRKVSAVGATLEPTPLIELAVRTLQYGGFALCALILLGALRYGQLRLGLAVFGLYIYAGAVSIGNILAPTASFDRDSFIMALSIHSIVLSGVSGERLLRIGYAYFAAVILWSAGLAILTPDTAFMTAADHQGARRLLGATVHPNSLAMACVATAIVCIVLWTERRRLHLLLLAVLAAVLLWLTGSRTGLASVALVILALGWRSLDGKFKALALTTSGLGLAVATVSPQVASIIADDNVTSVSGRTVIWQYAWQSFETDPIFGEGSYFLSDSFRSLYVASTEQQAVHAHDQWLQLLGVSGVVGTLGILLTVGAVARSIRNSRISLLFLAFFLPFSITEVPIREGAGGWATFVLLAAAIASLKRAGNHVTPPRAEVSRQDESQTGAATDAVQRKQIFLLEGVSGRGRDTLNTPFGLTSSARSHKAGACL